MFNIKIKVKNFSFNVSNIINTFTGCLKKNRSKVPAIILQSLFVGSVVQWLKRRAYDQQGLGSKLTCAILWCPWERHFTALSPAWWSWQAALN